ncbi:MAG TPA: DUF6273 domain-containing protein [Bacilli bacterium]|nr:DUF6273 domain-containing protein [Bacilli bacterium]HPS18872.1 DUF6273 domain-containing protein [Bacilli bacterium]
MTKKQFFTNASVTFAAILGIVITGIASSNHSLQHVVRGGADPYSMTFGSETNKIGTEPYSAGSYHSGTGVAYTGLNNSVTFYYGDFANPTNHWQAIKPGGYFTNASPINGMAGITITKANTTTHLGVYWSSTTSFYQAQYVEFNSGSSLVESTDFNSYIPNYIKVVALGDDDAMIDGITIEFECSDAHSSETNIVWGSYPQASVTGTYLTYDLDMLGGNIPETGNDGTWTPYDATTWVQDIIRGGEKYRGVYSSASYTKDWFKYESISWDVLSTTEEAGPLLASKKLLDLHNYYTSTSTRTIGGVTIYANNYAESDVRAWLNSSFYDTAFSTAEKSAILTANVDNSVASTAQNPNQYATANTSDKVFLLSNADIINSAYGFSSGASRAKVATDYASKMGLSRQVSGEAMWWTRSPSNFSGSSVRVVDEWGNINAQDVSLAYGMLPAIRVTL